MREPEQHSLQPAHELSAPVGNGRLSREGDVLWTKAALDAPGRYPTVARGTPVLDRALDDAIRGYQRDRGLKQDGWLAPGGETACCLAFDLAALEER